MLGATFTAPGPAPKDCLGDWGFEVVTRPGGKATFVCSGDPAYVGDQKAPGWWDGRIDTTWHPRGDSPTYYALGYGHELRAHTVSCIIDRADGVTCRQLGSAHGFTLSRQKYHLW